MNNIALKVADFVIKLSSEDGYPIFLEDSYLPFALSENEPNCDVAITAFKGIPNKLMNKGQVLYEAKDENQRYFTIEKYDTSYKFIIYSQLNKGTIQQVALLDKDFNNWQIYAEPSDLNATKFPLLYPLGPLMLYYLTVKYKAIMIHASGVYEGKKGRIFTGFSGTGKSTMAYLWQSQGAGIVNDDRLIIRLIDGNYYFYNTPMYYADMPKKVPLNSINLIKHFPENYAKKVSGAMAVSRVMAFCIQHGYNKNVVVHHLSFLTEMCMQIPVYEIGFLPEPSIVDFIRQNA